MICIKGPVPVEQDQGTRRLIFMIYGQLGPVVESILSEYIAYNSSGRATGNR